MLQLFNYADQCRIWRHKCATHFHIHEHHLPNLLPQDTIGVASWRELYHALCMCNLNNSMIICVVYQMNHLRSCDLYFPPVPHPHAYIPLGVESLFEQQACMGPADAPQMTPLLVQHALFGDKFHHRIPRCILVDWLAEVAIDIQISSRTLHLAVDILDRLLPLSRMIIPLGELQLVGAVTLMVARYQKYYQRGTDYLQQIHLGFSAVNYQ